MLTQMNTREPGAFNFFIDELKRQFRSPATWTCFLLMCALSYRFLSDSYWNDMVGSGRVPLNAPIVIYYVLAFGTFWASVFASAFMTSPIVQDLRCGIAPIIYSAAFRDRAFLIGKFFGGFVTLVFIMSGLVLSFGLLSWLQPSVSADVGHSFMAMPWRQAFDAFLIIMLPSCFFFAAIHFTLAATTGRMTLSYAFLVLTTLVFLSFEISFGRDTANKLLPQIIDPTGYIALQSQVFYWTAEEQSSAFLRMVGGLAWNRGVYIGIGVLTLAILLARADVRALLIKQAQKQKKATDKAQSSPALVLDPGRAILPNDSAFAAARETLRFAFNEFVSLAQERWFIGALLAGFLITSVLALRLGGLYQHAEGMMLPSAVDTLSDISSLYLLVGMIGVVFSAGESLSRDRSCGMKSIVDASAASDGRLAVGKALVAAFAAVAFTAVPAFSAIFVQILKGHLTFEWALYAHVFLYGLLPSLLVYAGIAFAIHTIVNQRAIGHILSILACMTPVMMRDIKVIEHPLAVFGHPALPPLTAFDALSDFNEKALHFGMYYIGAALFFVMLAIWIWPRGIETGFVVRLRRVPQAMRWPVAFGTLLSLAIAVVGGGLAYYAINVRNTYETIWSSKQHAAEYERRIRAIASANMLDVTTSDISVSLKASQRSLMLTQRFQLANTGEVTVDRLVISHIDGLRISCVQSGTTCLEADAALRGSDVSVFRFASALKPGETVNINVEASLQQQGYADEGFAGPIVVDGTLLDLGKLVRIGYDPSRELALLGDRKRLHLGARSRAPHDSGHEAVTRLAVLRKGGTPLSSVSVVTEPGQRVAAPGVLKTLEKGSGEWRYVFDVGGAPVRGAIVAGRYEVETRNRRGPSGTAVSLYALSTPSHAANAPYFLDAAERTMAVYEPMLGAFPYRSLWIAETINGELPGATSFANMIAVPEKQGWLHDYRSTPTLDWIFYVTARETLRVWWQRSIPIADIAGSPLLGDAIPEYLAIELIGQVHGKAAADRIESLRRDTYLKARSKLDAFENPVLEGQDSPINADRALLSLYQVRDIIGPEALRSAIARFHADAGVRKANGQARALQFVEALLAQASTTQRQAIRSIFERSLIHDLRIDEVDVTSEGQGYEVRLRLDTRWEDASAQTSPVPGLVELPVRVVGTDKRFTETHIVRVAAGTSTVSFKTGFAPRSIAIDPGHRFIEVNMRDNERIIQ